MTAKATYALLIYSTDRGGPPPADSERALEAHRALQAEASARGDLHAVARLDDAGRARTVVLRGDAHELTDGPFIETKEWLAGFYLIDCDSEDEALERARAICHIGGHAIEVRPVRWRWEP